MTIYHGQMAGRPAGGGLFMICGILEVDQDVYRTEALYRIGTPAPGCLLTMLSEPMAPGDNPGAPYYYEEGFTSDDVTNLLTYTFWSLIECDGPSLQIFLRKSSAPTSEGKEILMFSGILRQEASEPFLASERMHNMTVSSTTGEVAVSLLREDKHEELLACRGSQLGAMLKAPIWGWDAEPWAFNSIIAPEVALQADELRELLYRDTGVLSPSLTDDEKARMEELDALDDIFWLTGSRSVSMKDHHFRETMKHMVGLHGASAITPFTGVHTKDEAEASSARVKHSMNEVFYADQ